MGLLSYIRGDDLRSAGTRAEERTLTAQDIPPVMIQSTPGGAKVTPGNALATADCYACIRALSDAAASLPLVTYRRTSDGRERVEGRTAELLHRPSPATTQANLIGQLVGHLNTTGNGYLGKFRDSEGNVDQLALLHPERVVPEIKGGRPIYTVTGPKGEKSVHGTNDVVHVKGLSIDGVAGLSPVSQARVALGLSAQLAEHAATFFENDARPNGVLKVGTGVGQEQLAHLRAAWDHRHQGTRNAHRIAVVSGDIDFQPVSMRLEDAQFVEQRRLSATEVARVFRIPPWVIGAEAGSSMTYSNTEQQSLAFVSYSLRPWLVTIEQALSADRDLFPPNHYCEFLVDALLRADAATRAEVYSRALDPVSGWMSRNEVRRLENLAPEDDAAPVAPERNTNA